MKKMRHGGFNVKQLKLKKDSNGKKMPAVMHMKRGVKSKAITAKSKKLSGGEGQY